MKSIWVLLAALIVLAVLTSANADELSSVTTIQVLPFFSASDFRTESNMLYYL